MVKGKVMLTFLLLNVILLLVFSTFALSKIVDVRFRSSGVIKVYPGQSIKAALNSVSDGGTILIKSGNYLESNIVVNKTVTIVGENAETTVIDGGGTAEYIFFVIKRNVVIENITIRNTDPTASSPAVYMYNVENVTLMNVIITDVFYGVQIRSSNFTKITYNRISESFNSGVYVHGKSYNNTIAKNTLTNNPTAIRIASGTCQFNRIYHNNFINNTDGEGYQVINHGVHTVFDDGYPSGGNYWSDHVASDLRSGPDQEDVGSDGILDEGYPDPYSLWDRYPLVHPITNVEVIADENRFMVQVSTNSTLTGYDFNQSAKSLTLFIDGTPNTNGSCRVAVPKELLSSESPYDWIIIVYNGDCGQAISYWASEDSRSTYFYFTYSHSPAWKIEIVVAEPVTLTTLIFLAVAVTLIIFGKGLKQEKR
ncbi:MAG: right-handed parallel beta-helix repeat-containing protein [Candidatus Bathyarchaeota archaeon]|nr:right-handed parallel beta-helix repeat-containing protein [Candidatus Bathyarchaeota archaeon]